MQPVAPSSLHSLRGSVPTGAFMQVPMLPGCAHDWQRPEHSDRQQMLSKQKPLLQSPASAHAAPISAPVATDPPLPDKPPLPPLPPAPDDPPPPPAAPPVPPPPNGLSIDVSPGDPSF